MINEIEKVLKVFADNDLFEEGVELIGSWSFYFYQKYLGVEFFPLRTQDVDFLIPNPFKGKSNHNFLNQLSELGFHHDFRSDGSVYFWNTELKVEFITENKGRGAEEAIHIQKLGINAIPLRFMGLLLEDSILIENSDIKVRIPHPKNFCLYKLIIADRRRAEEKRLKDLQQVICVFKILDKDEFVQAFKSLPKGWQSKILKTIKEHKEALPLYYEEFEELLFTLHG